MKQFFGRKSRSALATVLMVSLLLHIVAIAVFGTIKLVTEALREETVFEAAPIVPPPQKEPEYTVNLKQQNRDTPPPRPPAIVVNNPSELDIPALDIDVNVDSTSVYGRGGGGFGGGLAGMREMALDFNFFGATGSGTHFAVLMDSTMSGWDVYGATQKELLKTLGTIKSGGASFMLIFFGGMDAGHMPRGGKNNKDFTRSDFWYPTGVTGDRWLQGSDIDPIIREIRSVKPGNKGSWTGSQSNMKKGGVFFRLGTQYWGALNAAYKLNPPPSTVFILIEPQIGLPNPQTVQANWEWYKKHGKRKPQETQVHLIVGKPKSRTNVEAAELFVKLVNGGSMSKKEIEELITYVNLN